MSHNKLPTKIAGYVQQLTSIVEQNETMRTAMTECMKLMQKAMHNTLQTPIINGEEDAPAISKLRRSRMAPTIPLIKQDSLKAGRHTPYTAIQAADLVIKFFNGQPVKLNRVARAMHVNGQTASSRLQRAVERGLIVRVQQALYAPPDYQVPDWTSSSVSKQEAQKMALPILKLLIENPSLQLREEIINAMLEAKINNTKASCNMRLWAATASKMIKKEGFGGLAVTQEGRDYLAASTTPS